MTDEYSRLQAWIEDYFPDASYSAQDIRDWANANVPAWSVISRSNKENILGDWENFIQPQVERNLTRSSSGFRERIRRFLARFRKS